MAHLLTPGDVRTLAAELGLTPTKKLGQNFVHDGATVRKIVRLAQVENQHVIEVGPGLGSLTLGLVEVASAVTAIEIDPRLARRLPLTVNERSPGSEVQVVCADALTVTSFPPPPPTALVANLPYNVAVPVLVTLLERVTSLQRVLVMVQAEVADRIVAGPGSKVYGAPSAKVAWFGKARRVATIARSVFWPVPNVDSALVAIDVGPAKPTAERKATFRLVEAAFATRRKTLRKCLASVCGSAQAAAQACQRAGIDPGLRGEMLHVTDFARLAQELA